MHSSLSKQVVSHKRLYQKSYRYNYVTHANYNITNVTYDRLTNIKIWNVNVYYTYNSNLQFLNTL